MKKILYILAALATVVTACNKELTPDLPGDSDEECITVSFSTAPMRTLRTKAESIDSETDDIVDRLDLYVFKSTDTTMIAHQVWSDPAGLDLSNLEFKYYDVSGTNVIFVALANLDAATAEYFAGLSSNQMPTYNGGLIPLQEGNFRAHRPIMGAGGNAYLGKQSYYSGDGNKTVDLTLYRYVARFEIEKITADFDDPELMNADVIVKGIVWTNVANALRPLMKWPSGYGSGWAGVVLGSQATYSRENEFGGVEYESGYHYYETNECHHGWVSLQATYNLSPYGATGALAADFPYIYNNNYKADKGALIADAPGYMATASSHFFTGDEGRVCSSTNASQSHVLNVNKEFYIMPIGRNSWSSYVCTEFDNQDDTMKMVIVVEINGKTYYYPYRALYIQPNSKYKVHNITLKGLGSEYSNFYVRKYAASVEPLTVGAWDNLEVDNIDLGYKDYAGTDIY